MKPIIPIFATAALLLSACGNGDKPAEVKPAAVPVPAAGPATATAAASDVINFPLENMDDWAVIENGMNPTVTAKAGVMKLGLTDGVSGVVYKGKQELPLADYELSWEARLLDGVDFFAAATFPVKTAKTFGTFINGGWGGGVTGISCLDGLAANENNTTTNFAYTANQWYKFRVQVTKEMIVSYIDDKKVVNVNITEKRVTLRAGDIEYCAPLGFASYQSRGEIKNVQIRKLKPGEVPLDPEAY